MVSASRGYNRGVSTNVTFTRPPEFLLDQAERPVSAELVIADYVELLIRAEATNPALWPPGMEHGASTLARVRRIEADCIAQHGEWDWELLAPELQDEYDGLCGVLDELRDDGTRISWAALKQRNPDFDK